MPLKKVKKGSNMYQGWITHTFSHLGGECEHFCSYCYVQHNRFGVNTRYKGKLRLIKDELKINYGINKIIFIEHMNDMFAVGVKEEWIKEILAHCNRYPYNQYVFQTKNPIRALLFKQQFPKSSLIGTTIETNRETNTISKAPLPMQRYLGIKQFSNTFVTIEPIMDFDTDILSSWIIEIKPQFVNIGADSKNTGLIEPTLEKIKKLIEILQNNKITIKKKINLHRLIK